MSIMNKIISTWTETVLQIFTQLKTHLKRSQYFLIILFINIFSLSFFWLSFIHTTWQRCNNFCCVIKENPNFQGILKWIIQILHYYCRKQHKNIENSQIIEQNVLISLPFSLLTVTCTSFAFFNSRLFSVLGHSTLQILNVISDHLFCI